MNFLKSTCAILLLLCLAVSSHAQFRLIDFGDAPSAEEGAFTNTTLAGLMHNGAPLLEESSSDSPLSISIAAQGKLTIAPQTCSKAVSADSKVGFKLAIRDYRTNTLWMYSEETLYELDLEKVLGECEMGDALVFMMVDRKFRLPKYEVQVGDGC